MAYRVAEGFCVTMYRDDLVILDTRANRFSFVNNVDLDGLNAELQDERGELAQGLYDLGVLVPASDSPLKLSKCIPHEGFEARWMMPLTSSSVKAGDRLRMAVRLARSMWFIRSATFETIRSALRSKPTSHMDHKTDSEWDWTADMALLNSVYHFDLSGNQCLTYSFTLVRHLRSKGFPANLCIGVRTRPFVSHAWVECYGEVVNDDPALREKVATIMVA